VVKLNDPKDQIIQYISKYIKTKKEVPIQESEEQTNEILKNLRDFLGYLESKNIINP